MSHQLVTLISKTNTFKLDRKGAVTIIEKSVTHWRNLIRQLSPVKFGTLTLNYHSIQNFQEQTRSNNDQSNKIREAIICCILNQQIPPTYYQFSRRWNHLKNCLTDYVTQLAKLNNLEPLTQIKCLQKAGRNYHYDFDLILNGDKVYHVEFKFNVSSVAETPQFVSPMKPSQYLESSYETYYYQNYLIPLMEKYGLPLPCLEEYLKYIHSPKPKILEAHQNKYYQGCRQSSKYSGNRDDIAFYQDCKKAASDSISSFITQYRLDSERLTNYLLDTQRDKYYMLYRDGKFKLQTINLDNYRIREVISDPKYYRYLAQTETGQKLKILLRWKNGNGIAYPSFQIS